MRLLSFLMLAACSERDDFDVPDGWFDVGDNYDVQEPLAFTEEPYGFPEAGDGGIAERLSPAFTFPRDFGTRIATGDAPVGATCNGWTFDDTLPVEVTGVVTLLPRYYFKTDGCDADDEKYYGSYFIEDDTGGMFVLGDSKVAHFDMGDTVTIRVRGVRRSFGQNMVYVHEVLAADRTARPIRYVERSAPLGDDDINHVRRITGTVVTAPDTFGEFFVQPDGSPVTCQASGADCAAVAIDSELNRRGITVAPGDRITVTGPVLFSYDIYKILVMRVGQLERHAAE